MSRRTQFQTSLISHVARLGGSHLTREARERTVTRFSTLMHEKGFTHLARPSDISGKHLRAYVATRQSQLAGARTLQNEMAHLRSVLIAAGRTSLAEAAELSNGALGISGGSRVGQKTAMSDDELQALCDFAVQQGRAGMAALLGLERHLGLRGNEAIHAQEDTLHRWRSEVSEQGEIRVLAGTKGGRPRTVRFHNKNKPLAAIDYAIRTAAQQGGFLVVRANGTPAGGLKQARSIYHSWAHRKGVQPHSARYAFARDQRDAYLAAGYSAREALMAVSHDLGHGSGRGRWVKSVYMR